MEEQGAGATEGVRELRSAHPDDLINPLLGGLGSGALLGRLQGRVVDKIFPFSCSGPGFRVQGLDWSPCHGVSQGEVGGQLSLRGW